MFRLFRRRPPKIEVSAPVPVRSGAPAKKLADHLRSVLAYLRAIGAEKRRPPVQETSFRLPKPAPGVLPSGAPEMAQDSQITSVYEFGSGYRWDGYGFMGYALLSELAQIPEYRKPSEILADEMTRKWGKVVSTSSDDKSELIREIKEEFDRLKVQDILRAAFEMDNFFGRAQIYIDLGTDGDELKTPLDLEAKIDKGSVKALRLIEPIWTYPNQYDASNPLAPSFYKPQSWFVLGQEIHSTRLVTIVSRPVPDMLKPAYLFGGVSLTQLLHPYVENWLRTRQSVSDITHNFSTPVLETDMAQNMTQGGAESLALRGQVFNASRDNLGLMIVDKNSEGFNIVAAPLGSLDKLQAQAQEHMAAVASIPLLKYFGLSPTGLNVSTEGETRSFYDTIASGQERSGTPVVRRLLRIVQMNLRGEIDDSIGWSWNALWELDEKSLAEVRKINAEIDGAYIDHGVVDQLEVRKTIAEEEDSRYAALDVDHVPETPEAEVDEGDLHEHGEEGEEGPGAPDAPDAHLHGGNAGAA